MASPARVPSRIERDDIVGVRAVPLMVVKNWYVTVPVGVKADGAGHRRRVADRLTQRRRRGDRHGSRRRSLSK